MRKSLLLILAVLTLSFSAQAAEILLAPTSPEAANNLSAALASAADGDVIVLSEGTYVESNAISFDAKGVTVKAADGANVVLQLKAPITISNGGKATLQGLKMDASQLGSHKHAIEVTDATDGKELLMDGCELYGYNVVDAAIHVAAANALKICEVKNCYFHDNMKSCIFLEGAVSKFLLINSTFANIATSTSSGYLSVLDIRNTTSFIANHCTFYNCQAINTDHAAIKVEGDALIANSVFVSPASQSSYRAVHAKDGWNVEAKNCLTFNYGASKNGIRSAATQTDCVVGDPLFVNAANGNFAFEAGSPALASGTNGTNMGDLRWNPSDVNDGIVTDTPVEDNPGEEEEEEEEIIPNGKKLYLSTEGNNNNDGLTPATAKATFAKAVAAALDGDTIIVADGLYSEAYEIKFEKLGVVVMAAEGAKPVVQLTGQWTSIILMATTTFEGITFDGAGIAYYLLSSKGTAAGTFTFKNCEFTNWDSYWAISNQYSDNTHVKSVVVDNCIFHNATGAAIHFNENGPRGAHACDNLTITNSTFYNLSVVEWVGIIQLDGNSGAKQPNNLTIDHITMYNYKTSELGGIVSDVKTNLTLTNSIIANPANVTQRYGYAYGTSTIDHNLLFNVTKGTGTHTNEIAGDPMFVFPDGGNFNLRPGSPALNAAADGKHLGDTRWGEAELVAVTGVELKPNAIHTFTTDTTKIEVVILPVEATNRNVTWVVADPAIVKLENSTLIALKPGETTVTVTTEDGGFTATATVVVEQKQFHPLVIEADNMYAAEDYTVPSYVQMLVAKEAARRDSTAANVAALQAKIDALQPYQAPYDVVVNINGDPRTNMAFAWFTNETMTENGVIQLVAKANATEADFADAITVEATTESTNALPYIVDDSGIEWKAKLPKDIAHTYISHKAIATALTPNTTYTYRVGVDGYWSEMGTFITAPEKTNEFSFIYMSDAHIESQAYIDDANAAARAALKIAPNAKFCAFPGDFVENYCSSEWEWERLFEEALRPMAYQMPIVPTDGNHDVTYGTNFQYHFNTDKTFHDAAEAAIDEQLDATTYSFMYGDVLFLVFSLQDYWKGTHSYDNLTSVYLTNHVGNWFKEQVAAHPEAKLRVGLVHYNIFSGSSHQDDDMGPLLRATLLPVIKECEIDFVIQGHDHCYEVMGPVDADTRKPILEAIADREVVSTSVSESGYKGGTYTVDNGAMYFIGSTCGHKRYWPYTKEEMEEDFNAHKVENYFDLFTGMFAQPDKPSFSVFTVKDRTITVESYTANPDGSADKFNTFVVKRTKAHTGEIDPPTSLEQVQDLLNGNHAAKILHNGQVLVIRDGVMYTVLGQKVQD